jgi:hypothetical protein
VKEAEMDTVKEAAVSNDNMPEMEPAGIWDSLVGPLRLSLDVTEPVDHDDWVFWWDGGRYAPRLGG